jgi:hypothetical protein
MTGLVRGVINDKNVHTRLPYTFYFAKQLFHKAISVFKFEGLPEGWDVDYLLYQLYGTGYIAVVKTDKFGVVPMQCSLYGQDIFYRPTHATISHPLITGLRQPRIGKQCELLILQPDYNGIMDIVNYHAELMAIASETMAGNLMNSKLSYIFAAGAKGAAESFKKMFDNVVAGDLGVVVDSSLFAPDGTPKWGSFSNNLAQNYIADRVIEDLRKIEQMFDTEVGIPNANTSKKERLITDEVNSNNDETFAKTDVWLNTLQRSVERVNIMFGLGLRVDYRNKKKEDVSYGVLQGNVEEPVR